MQIDCFFFIITAKENKAITIVNTQYKIVYRLKFLSKHQTYCICFYKETFYRAFLSNYKHLYAFFISYIPKENISVFFRTQIKLSHVPNK